MHATKAAVEEGIVPGGGVALLRASKALSAAEARGDQQIGVNIIARAIEEPLRWIATNAGHEGSIVVAKVQGHGTEEGFNALTETYENLVQAGVIDPTKVVRSALQTRGVDRVAAAHDRGGHHADSGKEQGRGTAGRRHGRRHVPEEFSDHRCSTCPGRCGPHRRSIPCGACPRDPHRPEPRLLVGQDAVASGDVPGSPAITSRATYIAHRTRTAHRGNQRRHLPVVHVADTGKQMMLDLKIQSSHIPSEQAVGTSKVDRGGNLVCGPG